MSRLHLFEFEDLAGCPASLRQGVTGYLRVVVRLTGQARLVAPLVAKELAASDEPGILDLCSGGGGPLLAIVDALRARGIAPSVTLSDRYPDIETFRSLAARSNGAIEYLPESVDATRIPSDLPGLRTLFNALHHFRDTEVRALLSDAANARRPLASFEFVRRAPVPLLGVLLSPLLALLLLPFARPLRPAVLVFTYLIPLIPLMVAWDGLVSWLRVHTESELRALATAAERPGYRFDVGRLRHPWLPIDVSYLLGRPESGRPRTRRPEGTPTSPPRTA